MRVMMPIILLFSTVILVLFHQGAYNYIPFTIMIALFLMVLFYRRLYQKTEITIEAKQLKQGDTVLQIHFQKPFSIPLQGHYEIYYEHLISKERLKLEGDFHLARHQQLLEIPIKYQYCGKIEISEAHFQLEDPLKWSILNRKLTANESYIIWPKIRVANIEEISGKMQGIGGNEVGENERIIPYKIGDKIHSIHWPLSSKLQTMMVQKPAYKEEPSLQMAFYFNDVKTVEQYDVFMSQCYSLLLQGHFEEVLVWKDEWQTISIKSAADVQALFYELLTLPLDRLYAKNYPPSMYTLFRFKGGIAV